MWMKVIFSNIRNVQRDLVDTQNERLTAQCMRKTFTFYLNSCFLGILVDLKKIEIPFPQLLRKKAPYLSALPIIPTIVQPTPHSTF